MQGGESVLGVFREGREREGEEGLPSLRKGVKGRVNARPRSG